MIPGQTTTQDISMINPNDISTINPNDIRSNNYTRHQDKQLHKTSVRSTLMTSGQKTTQDISTINPNDIRSNNYTRHQYDQP